MATRVIYSGRDTNVKYQLLDAGSVKNLDNLNKIELIFSTTLKVTGTLGSTTPIDFTTDSTFFSLRFADTVIPSGSYPNIKVIVYDGDSPNGLVWGTLPLVIKDNPYSS